MSTKRGDRSSTPPGVLLLCGALAGAALTAWDLGRASSAGAMPQDAAATVNGVAISRADHARATLALAGDQKTPLTGEDRQHVLDRLIEQELLLQRAVELGLIRSDSQVRGALVSGLISSVVAEADSASAQPSDAALQKHHDTYRARFRVPTQIVVQQLFFAGKDATRAHAAHERLTAGDAFGAVARDADTPPLALPRGPLPPRKLRDYLGATTTETALKLGPGEFSAPLAGPDGYRLLRVEQRLGGRAPPLSEIRVQVLADYQRRAGDERLRRYLNRLRAQAKIQLPGPAGVRDQP